MRGGFGLTRRLVAASLTADDENKVRHAVADYLNTLRDQGEEVRSLFREIGDFLAKPVGADLLPRRAAMLSVAATYAPTTDTAAASISAEPLPGFCTFRTTFEKWEQEQRPTSKTVYS